MEPTADGLAEFAADADIAAPLVDDALTGLAENGHASNGHAPNGQTNGAAVDSDGIDLSQMLQALQAMRVGDFSVRLPADRTGLAGKIADTFNEIVAANQRMAQQLDHIGQVVGRDGKTRARVKFALSSVVPGVGWRTRSTR